MLHTPKKPVELRIIHLNKVQKNTKKRIEAIQSDRDDAPHQLMNKLCELLKSSRQNKAAKQQDSEASADQQANGQSVYVLDFDGDIRASAVQHLREEISAIISVAKAGDEVVLRLESGGGQVHAYGLAAAQLERIKSANLKLTICVDKIAASGGYMMACTADQIIASDFAVLGSVGVVSQLPNFHEFLKKHDVHFEQFTAGEHKRTVTVFGENTDEDRAKHQADIERIHELFKDFVARHRPSLDVDQIATGEIWFGEDAKRLNLIDQIGTSDAYLLSKLENQQVYLLNSRSKPNFAEKLGLAEQLDSSVSSLIDQSMSWVGNLATKFRV